MCKINVASRECNILLTEERLTVPKTLMQWENVKIPMQSVNYIHFVYTTKPKKKDR